MSVEYRDSFSMADLRAALADYKARGINTHGEMVCRDGRLVWRITRSEPEWDEPVVVEGK